MRINSSLSDMTVLQGSGLKIDPTSTGTLTIRQGVECEQSMIGLKIGNPYEVSISGNPFIAAQNDFYNTASYSQQYSKADEELLKNAGIRLYNQQSRYEKESGAFIDEAPESPLDENGNLKIKGIGFIDHIATARNIYAQGNVKGAFDAADIKQELYNALNPEQIIAELNIRDTNAVDGSSYNIHKQIDNAAALYAFYESKIGEYYSGDEYAEKMEMVNSLFDEAINGQIGKLIGDGSYLSADKEGIGESVKTLFAERKSYYAQMLTSEDFVTGVEGTDDAWALDSAYFVAAKLRNFADEKNEGLKADTTTSAKYNVADLQAMAIMQNNKSWPSYRDDLSEEELGLYLGMDKVLMESLFSNKYMSDAGRAMLSKSFDLEVEKRIQMQNKYLDEMRVDPFRNKSFSYSPINKKEVLNAINTVMQAANASNATSGILKAIKQLEGLYLEKRDQQAKSSQKMDSRYDKIYTSHRQYNGIFSDYTYGLQATMGVTFGNIEKYFLAE